MEIGKIYFISFGPNTQLVVRFKEENNGNYFFFDHLHYWNGHETFNRREQTNYSVTHGIEEIREATQPEKMALIRFEIENHCI